MQAAFFGGIYNNYLALRAALQDARRRGAEAIYCLGDIGGFGPFPDRSIEILRSENTPVVHGNYDDSVGNGRPDCGCGYTDPRDNHYARISYAYTVERTSAAHRPWLAGLPPRREVSWEAKRFIMVQQVFPGNASSLRGDEWCGRDNCHLPEYRSRSILDEHLTRYLGTGCIIV